MPPGAAASSSLSPSSRPGATTSFPSPRLPALWQARGSRNPRTSSKTASSARAMRNSRPHSNRLRVRAMSPLRRPPRPAARPPKVPIRERRSSRPSSHRGLGRRRTRSSSRVSLARRRSELPNASGHGRVIFFAVKTRPPRSSKAWPPKSKRRNRQGCTTNAPCRSFSSRSRNGSIASKPRGTLK